MGSLCTRSWGGAGGAVGSSWKLSTAPEQLEKLLQHRCFTPQNHPVSGLSHQCAEWASPGP